MLGKPVEVFEAGFTARSIRVVGRRGIRQSSSPTPRSTARLTGGMERSPELTILAPTAVISREFRGVPIVFLLASHTQANAGKGFSSCLRNLVSAFDAMGQ